MHEQPGKALFLDRDGVINEDVNYASRPEQITFVDGIFALCRAARAKAYRIIVVTNQAGIGRGLYTAADFHALMDWMKQRFEAEQAGLDHVYYCPYHPVHGQGQYKQDSFDRKPNPGMILRAGREHNLDLAASLMIGDKESDMRAGESAGVGRLLLLSQTKLPPYRTIGSLHDALAFL